MNYPAQHTIELCELKCPNLLIAVIEAVDALQPNQIIEIKATDLNAPSSIASWARQSGNDLLDMYEENGCFVFLLRRAEEALLPSAPLVKRGER